MRHSTPRMLSRLIYRRHLIVPTTPWVHATTHLRYYSFSAAEPVTTDTPLFKAPKLIARIPTTNVALQDFIARQYELCQPDDIYVCDGSKAEYDRLCGQLVDSGVMERLDSVKRPHSFIARTDPGDVARSEGSTYICSIDKKDAGPTNNWMAPGEMRQRLQTLFAGSMRGRTMYVIPFSMGPIGSPLARVGVQVTDSPFVVANMHLMTRVGQPVLDLLSSTPHPPSFVPCVHSVGVPRASSDTPDVPWPCNLPHRTIAHFPETREIWSFGSGYGGNSLLGKKCLALRIASVMARDEGWLAEHMLILGITSPRGHKHYIAAAFPSACGKTNLAMMTPTLPGWKVECVGDDIAWMRFNPTDGRLYAINPEAGFFGVAPGTSPTTNPSAMQTIATHTLFTNVARTADNDVYWEGLGTPPTDTLQDWRGQWRARTDAATPFAHPNARFTVAARQSPQMDAAWESPQGVPISALLLGGRRPTTVPLVYEAFDWTHGTFLGSAMASEKTAAAEGQVGELRFDPMAMLPFCGYHMGDYLKHWLSMGEDAGKQRVLPRIFHVNWFRQDGKGRFMWPGFGENARVLEWIVGRVEGRSEATRTAIGYVPTPASINTQGLNLSQETLEALLRVDARAFLAELTKIRAFHATLGDALPPAIRTQSDLLEARLKDALQE